MRRFRRTTLITVFCLAVLAGLGLARLSNLSLSGWALLLLLPSVLLLRPKNAVSFWIVIFLGLSLGLWRGSIYMQKLSELKNLSGQNVTIIATATTDTVYSQASQMEFTANRAQFQGRNLAGSFKITGYGEPMVYRGDRVQISGKLYPSRGSNQARLSYAQFKRVGLDNNWINRFTRRFSAGMQSALPEPNASFGLGLLIGQRNNLSSELTDQLIMVGLVHIVAVSGYNLTILVRAAAKLKMASKYQQLMLSLGLIIFFILMTGFCASIVRAAIVSILSLWAWFYGSKIRPLLILTFTAALTAMFNPFYLWGDASWYLSFLAFAGILIIAPQITARLFKRPPKIIISTAIDTLSAEVMTLPLIMLFFGQLSLIGVLANVLVVPLVPLAMLLSATAAAAGMWLAPLAGWLAWPANLLLTYILDIVKLFASIPGIFTYRTISLPTMLYFYAMVILAILLAHRSKKNQTPVDS